MGAGDIMADSTRVLILDGHPDSGRLTTALLDHYVSALPPGVGVERIAVRDMKFDPTLHRGYVVRQAWEPDLERMAAALLACDHIVVAFPLWWGAEPAPLKGLLDRLLMPRFAFQYHSKGPLWDRLLVGRSADLIVTMDTPPLWLRLVYGDAVIRRWRRQILGFCGFKPVRVHRFGMTRNGEAEKKIAGWRAVLSRAAATAPGLARAKKLAPRPAG